VAILASAAFTAGVLIWHFGFDDAWWRFPVVKDWIGFELYAWAYVFLLAAFLAVWFVAGLLFAIPRRRLGAAFLTVALPIVVSAGCAAIYWPFHGRVVYRVDRVLRLVKEPASGFQHLVVLVGSTLVLELLYLLTASLRRAPRLASTFARVTLAVLCGVYLHVVWILIILPISNGWEPVDWQRPDLLTRFQPCRGAVLWFTRNDGKLLPFGRIDDLWLQFADPRRNNAPGRAISVATEWAQGYAWLNAGEADAFSIRQDDPAVMHCDQRWRRERVVPAEWHTLGVTW